MKSEIDLSFSGLVMVDLPPCLPPEKIVDVQDVPWKWMCWSEDSQSFIQHIFFNSKYPGLERATQTLAKRENFRSRGGFGEKNDSDRKKWRKSCFLKNDVFLILETFLGNFSGDCENMVMIDDSRDLTRDVFPLRKNILQSLCSSKVNKVQVKKLRDCILKCERSLFYVVCSSDEVALKQFTLYLDMVDHCLSLEQKSEQLIEVLAGSTSIIRIMNDWNEFARGNPERMKQVPKKWRRNIVRRIKLTWRKASESEIILSRMGISKFETYNSFVEWGLIHDQWYVLTSWENDQENKYFMEMKEVELQTVEGECRSHLKFF